MRTLIACLVIGSSACSSPHTGASQEDVQVAIGAAAVVGGAVDLANVALSNSVGCATVTQACNSYPCASGSVSIALGAGCPLPLGMSPAGTIVVSGSWNDATDATISESLSGVKASGGDSFVASASGVELAGSTVTFTGSDLKLSGASLVTNSTWMVEIDDGGTAADPTDDTYTVSGGYESVSNGSTAQISVSGVVVSPACRLNPTGGEATWQSVSGTSIDQGTLTFHSTCDGKADSFGSSVSVSFFLR